MACADSNRAVGVTVDILSSFKTCPASLFSSLRSDCQTIIKGTVVEGGQGGKERTESSLTSLWIVLLFSRWGELNVVPKKKKKEQMVWTKGAAANIGHLLVVSSLGRLLNICEILVRHLKNIHSDNQM